MSGKSPNPNLIVYGQTRDGKFWKRIGVAWTNTSKGGTKFISITLDFDPNTDKLTIWPSDSKPERISDAQKVSAVRAS